MLVVIHEALHALLQDPGLVTGVLLYGVAEEGAVVDALGGDGGQGRPADDVSVVVGPADAALDDGDVHGLSKEIIFTRNICVIQFICRFLSACTNFLRVFSHRCWNYY